MCNYMTHLKSFNQALLAKNIWRFIYTWSNLPCSQVIKCQYCPRTDFLGASIGYKPSPSWSSIWEDRWLIEMGCRWRLGNGFDINVWLDKWLPKATPSKVLTPCCHDDHGRLWMIDFGMGQRREEKVRDLSCMLMLRLCLEYLSVKGGRQILGSGTTTKQVYSVYSVKSGYHLAKWYNLDRDRAGPSMSRGSEWLNIWGLKISPRL